MPDSVSHVKLHVEEFRDDLHLFHLKVSCISITHEADISGVGGKCIEERGEITQQEEKDAENVRRKEGQLLCQLSVKERERW